MLANEGLDRVDLAQRVFESQLLGIAISRRLSD